MMDIDIDALTEEVTSAANIVTNHGYYEIDVEAVTECLDKALATTRAELAAQSRVIYLLQWSGARFHKAIRAIQQDCPPEIAERINKALADNATPPEAIDPALAAAFATIHQLGENAAKAAGEYAEEVAKHRETLAVLQTAHDCEAEAVAEIERLQEVVLKYGDRIAMANAPAHLQQSIDDALARAAITEPTDG